ncbi:hypothetical protein KFE25_012131 [Diacronema lutheri]|uniref:Uncharacterized protein n=1 Tax=Diacronema lutheri TaxID=2081491 RepID=A0A8J5X6R0_DIALT|nr:hypothetical protein KFE25_012131 [Diacronema lutheri]
MGASASVEPRFAPLFEHGRAHAGCTIAQPKLRGITLAQFRRLVHHAAELCAQERWMADGVPLARGALTLRDVEQRIVAPLAAQRGGRSLVEMFAHAPQLPRWYVAVRADTRAADALRMLEQHAFDRCLADDDAIYWLPPLALSADEAAAERILPPLQRAAAAALTLVDGIVSLLDGAGDADDGQTAAAGGHGRDTSSGRSRYFDAAWPAYALFLACNVERPSGAAPMHDVYALEPHSAGRGADGRARALAIGLVDGFAARDGGSAHTKARREQHFLLNALDGASAFSLARALKGARVHAAAAVGRGGGAGAADAEEGDPSASESTLILAEAAHLDAGAAVVDATVATAFSVPLLGMFLERAAGGPSAAAAGCGGGIAGAGEDARALSRALRALRSARRARLAVCCLEPPSASVCRALTRALPDSLAELRAVRLHAAVLPALIGRLPTVAPNSPMPTVLPLRALELRECGLSGVHAAALAAAVVTQRLPALVSLELPNNGGLGDDGCVALARVLVRAAHLRNLCLAECNVGDRGAATLGEALAGRTGGTDAGGADASGRTERSLLETLDVSFNLIGDDGAAGLAHGLAHNATLTRLDLKLNQVQDRGAAALAASLHSETALTALDLFYNGVGDNGAVALADCLRSNTTLATLDLFYNDVGDVGAAALSASLATNRALRRLDVRENERVTDVEVRRLAAAWRSSGRPADALGAISPPALTAPAAVHASGARRSVSNGGGGPSADAWHPGAARAPGLTHIHS